jgi:excisionase family DNA binding protein
MSQQTAIVLRIADLAKLLGCSQVAARRMVERGQLPARRIGRRVVILRDELDSFLRALPRAPETTEGDR